jgi:hypothetical protein
LFGVIRSHPSPASLSNANHDSDSVASPLVQSCSQARSACHWVSPGDWLGPAQPVAGIVLYCGVGVSIAEVI